MKILFVHEVSYLGKVIFEMHEFPEKLAERGHEIHYLDYPEGAPISRIGFRTRSRTIRGRINSGIEIHLHTLPKFLPYPLDRLWTAATSYLSVRQKLRTIRPDVVVIYGVPTNGWQTILAARKCSIPCVYRAIDVSHELRRSVFRPLIRLAESFVYRHADQVLANNAALASYGIKHGCAIRKMKVLFPGFELPETTETEPSIRKTIVFMGTFFRFAGLSRFIADVHHLCLSDQNVRIQLIGGGEENERLQELVSELGLEKHVDFTGFVPFGELPTVMKGATVAVVPFDEIPVAMNALPGKVPQYLLCNLPTVSTRLTGLMSFLPEGAGVMYASPGLEFVERVRTLLDDPMLRSEIVQRGRKVLGEVASWDRVLPEFEKVLSNVKVAD